MEYFHDPAEQKTVTVSSLLVQQLTKEMNNYRMYKTFSGICALQSFNGASAWFEKQATEELEHFSKIFGYMIDRDMDPMILEQPAIEFYRGMSLLEMFNQALQLENETTNSLTQLNAFALTQGDFLTTVFLDWFMKEQVEEIKTVSDIRNRLEIANESPAAILMIDCELNG